MLANSRHEKFAAEVAAGTNAATAYLRAGYKVTSKSAAEAGCRLSKQVNVRVRIDELRAEALEHTRTSVAITIDTLTEMFLADRKLAYESRQPNAACTATERIARLHGFPLDGKAPGNADATPSSSSPVANTILDFAEMRRIYGGKPDLR
jgi:phage terminase small subunit